MLRAISFGVFWRLGALDQGDHAVEEALARSGGDAHHDPVGEHPGAAGDRRAVAAGLADDRGRLAGDGRLVDGGDALDDVAVAGDQLAGLDDAQVADVEGRRRPAPRCVPSGSCTNAVVSERVLRRVSAWALPRPSATASAKLANSTVNQSQSGDQPGEHVLRGVGGAEVLEEQDGGEDAADLDHEHHRVAGHLARVELAEGVDATPGA